MIFKYVSYKTVKHLLGQTWNLGGFQMFTCSLQGCSYSKRPLGASRRANQVTLGKGADIMDSSSVAKDGVLGLI